MATGADKLGGIPIDKLQIELLRGDALAAALGDVAGLRIEVFRDWPYLYEGSLDYETHYLADFAKAPNAIVVAAVDAGRIVGAATGAPLTGHTAEFAPLFASKNFDPDKIFYFGESVLLSNYRGRGIGHAFFDHREAHARCAGLFTHSVFCGVVRAPDDPRSPAGYEPLDGFWRKRGYAPVEGLVGRYSWREIGAYAETEKPMQFWMRAL